MTDRSKIVNILSIREQSERKTSRRKAKVNPSGQELVPVVEPIVESEEKQQAANDAISIYERDRSDLANMGETRLFSDRQLDQLGIVHPRSRNRPMVDAMRQLRTKLYSLKKDGNFSVLVSSLTEGGGGSFVALNLAATIAFDKAKTSLLVDANLHSPVLHKLLKLVGRPDAHGLVDYLETPDLGIEHIVSPSGISRMRIIPAGNQDEFSNEHLASSRYEQLMTGIQQRYDNRFVVVDGPSMESSADAKILSDICDYTVLVVPYGGVSPGALDTVIDNLDERKIAGIVLNDQPN